MFKARGYIMANEEKIQQSIKAFSKEFSLIKKASGWSTNDFVEKIGISRQAINNYENQKNGVTKAHYLAMRYMFDDEIKNNEKENEMLKVVLDAFVDNPNKYNDIQKKEIRKNVEILSPALTSKKVSKKDVYVAWSALVTAAAVGLGAIIGSIAIGLWNKK